MRYFDPHCANGNVQVQDQYFTVKKFGSCTSSGLMKCLERALLYIGIADWEQETIGQGCDYYSYPSKPILVRSYNFYAAITKNMWFFPSGC